MIRQGDCDSSRASLIYNIILKTNDITAYILQNRVYKYVHHYKYKVNFAGKGIDIARLLHLN
jgi:hypothetical protein